MRCCQTTRYSTLQGGVPGLPSLYPGRVFTRLSLAWHKCNESQRPWPSVSVSVSLCLQIMRERVNDVNAFTRSKVLQVWATLCESDAIPKKTQPAVVELATVRLEDKSAQVQRESQQDPDS